MEFGDSECVRVEVDEGESVRLEEATGIADSGASPLTARDEDESEPSVMIVGCARGVYGFGLSLPVGPLPSGGRLAGGRLSAARSVLFSSSSSATLFSRA